MARDEVEVEAEVRKQCSYVPFQAVEMHPVRLESLSKALNMAVTCSFESSP